MGAKRSGYRNVSQKHITIFVQGQYTIYVIRIQVRQAAFLYTLQSQLFALTIPADIEFSQKISRNSVKSHNAVHVAAKDDYRTKH